MRRALIGRWFFAALGLVSAVGTAAVFWVGGYLVIRRRLEPGYRRDVLLAARPAVRPSFGDVECPRRVRDVVGVL